MSDKNTEEFPVVSKDGIVTREEEDWKPTEEEIAAAEVRHAEEKQARQGKFQMILRMVCGGYLIYTAYQLLHPYWDSTLERPKQTVLFVGVAVVFLVIGVLLLVSELRKLLKKK